MSWGYGVHISPKIVARKDLFFSLFVSYPCLRHAPVRGALRLRILRG